MVALRLLPLLLLILLVHLLLLVLSMLRSRLLRHVLWVAVLSKLLGVLELLLVHSRVHWLLLVGTGLCLIVSSTLSRWRCSRETCLLVVAVIE